MKYLILLISFVASCASMDANRNISFETIKNFKAGLTTETEVIAQLGKPQDSQQHLQSHVATYKDAKTGYQLLSLTYNSENKLMRFVWIPQDNTNESSLKAVKSIFQGTQFSRQDHELYHSTSKTSDLTSLETGITIKFNPNTEVVEAIGFFPSKERIPATKE